MQQFFLGGDFFLRLPAGVSLNKVKRVTFCAGIRCVAGEHKFIIVLYSRTWELGTRKGLSKTVLNSEVVLFIMSISFYVLNRPGD